jgi:hypothetical protein
MVGTSQRFIVIIGCLFLLVGSTSYGHGILPTHPDAYFGGGPDGGYWRGEVAFDNGSGLAGHLAFAVFTEGQFNANFGGDGYLPSSPPTGGLVYTYQLFNLGDDAISAEIVGITNPANTIGAFDLGDIAPSSAAFVGPNARWLYSAPAIGTGESSWGMAFSSPNKPMSGAGLTIDGGASIVTLGLPTPGPDPIPEPSSALMALLAGCLLGWRRWQLRQR